MGRAKTAAERRHAQKAAYRANLDYAAKLDAEHVERVRLATIDQECARAIWKAGVQDIEENTDASWSVLLQSFGMSPLVRPSDIQEGRICADIRSIAADPMNWNNVTRETVLRRGIAWVLANRDAMEVLRMAQHFPRPKLLD